MTAFDVWEASYLGGGPLSATLRSRPSRRKYGRLYLVDATAFLGDVADGRPYVAACRGGADLDAPVQAAEFFALPQGTRGPVSMERREGTEAAPRYAVRTNATLFPVVCRSAVARSHGTCNHSDGGNPSPGRTI
ncbi:hypothetical protein [Jannaschia sp. 2305UL9-9]|uniref:hypothetical protein n=1 Tax=Jannaschia sp. 2305UL9-9 TaxID=3121638 RepID=UPI0035274CE6